MRWALKSNAVVALVALVVLKAGLAFGTEHAFADSVVTYTVVGDRIEYPLGGHLGDAARGRAIVLDRRVGNCLICHVVPEPDERFMGDLGPSLAGVGRTLSAAQLRLRLVDAARLNPRTIMPPYHRTTDLNRVAPEYRDRPVLTAQQIEDVVTFLSSLK